MNYITRLCGTKDGAGTFGTVSRMDVHGRWVNIGVTRTYWTASQLTRARSNAETIAKRYHREHYSQLPFNLHKR